MSIRHLTASDYRIMPWANGLGQTVEMIRYDDENGQLMWRLSMASVTEDGAFSIFPEVERNLTVLSGEGFDLVEDVSGIRRRAALLRPVSFAGDIAISAQQVTAPCQDFNVMTSRGLPKPEVWVVRKASHLIIIEGWWLALFALTPLTIQTSQGELALKTHELLLCEASVSLLEGSLICVCFSTAVLIT